MRLRLYDFAASPFCVKVRSILDDKKLPYERIDAARPSVMAELKRRGGIGKVPVLDIDGDVICDSRVAITAFMDAMRALRKIEV